MTLVIELGRVRYVCPKCDTKGVLDFKRKNNLNSYFFHNIYYATKRIFIPAVG